MTAVFNWTSTEGPLFETGRLVVTDTNGILQNSGWGLGPSTGRLIDLQIGWLHIYPILADQETLDQYGDFGVPGPREQGPYQWAYSFDFENDYFNAHGGELVRFGMNGGVLSELKTGWDESNGPALLTGVGYWQRDWSVPEPATVTMLGFVLVALAIVRKMRRHL